MNAEFWSGFVAGVSCLTGLLFLIAFGAVKTIAFAKARKPAGESYENLQEAPL